MDESLIAWRNGQAVARFTKTAKGAKLEYAPGVEVGVSLSLPVGLDMGEEQAFNWLSNLLPTNPAVVHDIATRHGIGKDTFSLLSKVGEDVPGDVSLIPEGLSPQTMRTFMDVVSGGEIAEEISRIKALRTSTQISFGGRFSLGGAQSKFSLTERNGIWFRTTYHMPSTHIFKPGNERRFTQIEEAEAAAMNLAKVCGVRVAEGTRASFHGETSYVTKRFDRYLDSNGSVVRTQIEDLGQILGFKPMTSYISSTQRMLGKAVEVGLPKHELYVLAQQIIFNVHIGNLDAHVRNYSLMRTHNGIIASPLYDSIPLVRYGPKEVGSSLAMTINGKKLPWEITMKDWFDWSVSSGLDPENVLSVVEATVGGIQNNVAHVFRDWNLEDTFRRAVLRSCRGLGLN